MSTLISYDESGELTDRGYFFQLSIPFDREEARELASSRDYVASLDSKHFPDFHVEALYKTQPRVKCVSNPEHVVKYEREKYSADLFGTKHVEPFVCDAFGVVTVVNSSLAEALRASKLTGFDLERLAVKVNQSDVKDAKLYVLKFTGRPCLRSRVVRVPDPNLCPFCRKSEVVCAQCLDVNYDCPRCKKTLLELESEKKRSSKTPFGIEPPPKAGRIVDGKLWDGSDFMEDETSQGIISGRALSFFMEMKVTSFLARKCRVDISQMSRSKGELLATIEYRGR